jgi:hypothetical protein
LAEDQKAIIKERFHGKKHMKNIYRERRQALFNAKQGSANLKHQKTAVQCFMQVKAIPGQFNSKGGGYSNLINFRNASPVPFSF